MNEPRGVTLDALRRDLRYAVRQLRRHPGYAAIVAVTLALGIGANTAVFSVVDAVLLRPLPYGNADRLVRLWSAYPSRGEDRGTTSKPDVEDWRAGSRTIESMGAWTAIHASGLVTMREGTPSELETEYVTPGFFETLGVPAARGRALRAADHDRGGNDHVVVLSYGAWQRLFGGEEGVIGRTVTLSAKPWTVAGVMPRGFSYPRPGIDAWVPLEVIPESGIPRLRQVRFLSVVGRLAPGATPASARREMGVIAGRLARAYPDADRELTAVSVQPLRDQIVGSVRPAMLAILGAVGLVLLIGCVNVAGLALARSEEREREIGIRSALGAPRAAILRQLLVESLVLAGLGGALGLLLGAWGTRAVVALAPSGLPRLGDVTVSGRVLAFAAAVSLVSALASGLLPALRASRTDPAGALGESSRGGTAGRRAGRLRSALLVGEVALVALLAVGAGLLVRSYAAVRSVDPGFDPRGLLTLRVSAQGDDYKTFLEQALRRVRDVPGVTSAAIGRPLPLGPHTFRGEGITFTIAGRPTPPEGQEPSADLRFVSPGFFRTMGIPLLSGRTFTDGDDADGPPVVVLSRSAARKYWGDRNPVGQRILVGRGSAQVVGVVDDVKQVRLEEEATPAAYVPFAQTGRRGMSFVVRTDAPAAVVDPIRKAIWSLRPNQPIQDVASMATLVDAATAGRRFSMALLGAFAGLALLLAAVGIYGVVAYTVSRRVREIGIRMALGAGPSAVVRLVVWRSLGLVALGAAAGLAAAALAGGVLGPLLYGVGRLDPWAFGGAAAVLLVVAAAGGALPARRASRVDPLVAIRTE
ncbi:MAG TPA: ABC transporter permease [Gemmatimonadota bacterium]|nr:ABC transporter permease [Gemmatimonadota bacterium]